MSTNLTYTTLVEKLKSYTEREDDTFAAEIPNFVNLAENRLATDLKQQGFQTVVTGALPISSPTMEKPAFWRETISFNYTNADGEIKQILLRNYEYLRNFWPGTTADEPRYYADYNFENFFLSPPPVAAYTFELVYYARLTPLDATNEENWLTLNAPQALLAAALAEAWGWCKNNEQTGVWEGKYAAYSGALLGENQERLGDRNVKVGRG